MKKYRWFTHDRQMGKHWRGPMEYQPQTWQGWLILFIHFILTLALLYYFVKMGDHLLLSFLFLFIGVPVILASYSMIAHLSSTEKNGESPKIFNKKTPEVSNTSRSVRIN